MTGTRIGGKKAAKTIKRKFRHDQFKEWGRQGGSAKVPKGTSKWTLEKRVEVGRRGGLARAKKYNDDYPRS